MNAQEKLEVFLKAMKDLVDFFEDAPAMAEEIPEYSLEFAKATALLEVARVAEDAEAVMVFSDHLANLAEMLGGEE